MAKPSSVPTWSTAGGTDPVSGQTNNLEPPASKKAAGWRFREKLPRNWLNWWMNLVYQWCAYLSDLANGVLAWELLWTTEADVRHGEAVVMIGMGEAATGTGGGVASTPAWLYVGSAGASAPYWGEPQAPAAMLAFRIPLKQGDRLKTVAAIVDVHSGVTLTMRVFKANAAAGTQTQIGSDTSVGPQTKDALVVTSLSDTVDANEFFYINFSSSNSGVDTKLFGVSYTFDRP